MYFCTRQLKLEYFNKLMILLIYNIMNMLFPHLIHPQSVDAHDLLNDAGPWTVFAPSNDVWQALPEGTTDYLMSLEVSD